jgi:hypothetical protein
MNHFGDWKNDDQVSNLYKRSLELEMLQLFQLAALENIVKHRPSQIKAQESQHTIVSDALAVGTTVFVKI